MEGKNCVSCKKKIANDKGSVIFKCPGCKEYEVIRCSSCRGNAVRYTCPQCSFSGPN